MATSPLFGWEEPDDTDLVKDGAAAIRTLGNAIDTSMGDLLGGTTGQVLSKASNTNMDFTWVAQDDSNAIQNALLTTTGDTIYASGASTPARLGIGSTGQVLTVSGGVPAWSTPAGGGSLTLLYTNTWDNSVTNYTFSSISGSYTNLLIVGSGLQQAGSASESGPLNIQFNGDTGSNYWVNQIRANPTISQNSGNASALDMGIVCANTSDSSLRFGNFAMMIYGYSSSTLYKAITYQGGSANDNVYKSNITQGSWNNTAAITSIKVANPYAFNLKAGTIKIYGVN